MDAKGRHVFPKPIYGPRPAHWKIARGERHGMAKLSEDQVREIRRRLIKGQRGKDIAGEFSVGADAISKIKTGHTWKSVQ
jgi:hypothetical protein